MDCLNVVGIDKSESQHWVDVAKCLACNHSWVAVAPRGSCVLECPKCKAKLGVRTTFGGVSK